MSFWLYDKVLHGHWMIKYSLSLENRSLDITWIMLNSHSLTNQKSLNGNLIIKHNIENYLIVTGKLLNTGVALDIHYHRLLWI